MSLLSVKKIMPDHNKWVKASAKFTKEFLDSNKFKLIAVVFTAFNAYVLFCISTDKYTEDFKSKFGTIGDFFITNASWFVFFSVLAAGIIQIIYALASRYADNIEDKFLELEDSHTRLKAKHAISVKVLETIDKIVVQKRHRFAETCRNFREQTQINAKTIFTNITRPDLQIRAIIEGLEACLKSTYPDDYIKIALMRVKDNKLDDWELFYPLDTRAKSTITELSVPTSTISRALNLKKMVIVSDVIKETEKADPMDMMYVPAHTDLSDNWCQLCYPVTSITNNKVVFIISIAIKRENVFTKDNESFLKWLLKFFDTRLALEHSLQELKGKAK